MYESTVRNKRSIFQSFYRHDFVSSKRLAGGIITEGIDHPDVLLCEHLLHLVWRGRCGKVQVSRTLPAQQVSKPGEKINIILK